MYEEVMAHWGAVEPKTNKIQIRIARPSRRALKGVGLRALAC